MELKDKVELMHTLDQLADDQHVTLMSTLFLHDRKLTNQLLEDHFTIKKNNELATKINNTARELLLSADSNENVSHQSSATAAVMNDPFMLSEIAQYLPIKQIVSLEHLNRKSFIALRNYPAIDTVDAKTLSKYLKYCTTHSMAPNMNRFRNVRDLSMRKPSATMMAAAGMNPIFQKVEKLRVETDSFRESLPDVMAICNLENVISLHIYDQLEMSLDDVTKMKSLIFGCTNLKTLIFDTLDLRDVSQSQLQLTINVKQIREKLPNVTALHFENFVAKDIQRIFFDALSPQILSLHFFEFESEDGALALHQLLQDTVNLNKLEELCWAMDIGNNVEHGIRSIVDIKIPNLRRVCIYFDWMFDSTRTDLNVETRKNFIKLFQRDLERIELVKCLGRCPKTLIDCLKKGLLQRQHGGNMSILLSYLDESDEADADIFNIIGTALISKVVGFEVISKCNWQSWNMGLLANVPNSQTFYNKQFVCCQSLDFEQTHWISDCYCCRKRIHANCSS